MLDFRGRWRGRDERCLNKLLADGRMPSLIILIASFFLFIRFFVLVLPFFLLFLPHFLLSFYPFLCTSSPFLPLITPSLSFVSIVLFSFFRCFLHRFFRLVLAFFPFFLSLSIFSSVSFLSPPSPPFYFLPIFRQFIFSLFLPSFPSFLPS